MEVTGIIFLLVAGFLLPTTEGIFCYDCVDCGAGQGTLVDCSRFSNSSSCYFTKTFSTDEISKSCGTANLDLFGLPEGCTTGGDTVVCRCTQDRCNVNELATSSAPNATTSPATTTSFMGNITTNAVATGNTTMVATSTPAEAFYCYECLQCGSSLGTLVNCASFTTSQICYSQKDPSGDVFKTCGNDRLDELNIPFGCTRASNYYTCKCSESGCNDYRDTTTSPTTTPTTSPTTTPTTSLTTSSRTEIWDRFLSAAATTHPPRRGITCYTCRDCGPSDGVIYDCATAFQSTSCYFLKEPSGTITRTCGTPEIDELEIAYGCHTSASNHTICRCDTDNCNRYVNITSGGAVRPITSSRPVISTTQPSSTWMCYNCSNCGSSVGDLVECSTFTNSRTCLLMLEPSGEVSRQCGTEATDELNLLDGCSLRSGTTICKCSQNACNEYPLFRTRNPSGK